MASRTLRWLVTRRLIVSRRDGDNINRANHELLFALTELGASEVRKLGSSLVASKVHARDYLRHAHAHRTACNSVYVALHGEAWSELEIRAGECPVSRFRYRLDGAVLDKIPDLVAADGDRFEWIEVENSWRSDKDLTKVIECMRDMFSVEDRPLVSRMHFIVTVPGARAIGRRLKARMTHGPESGYGRQVRELDARILKQHLRISELDRDTLELRNLELAPD